MNPRVLLVTGSRQLADTSAARHWTTATLLSVLLDMRWRRIVHGASGIVDLTADAVADTGSIERLSFALDGVVRIAGGRDHLGFWTDGRTDSHGRHATHPLRRNDAMVRYVADHRAAGGSAFCLALVAPWSRTGGAMYTAQRALRAGVQTWIASCPEEHAPARERGTR